MHDFKIIKDNEINRKCNTWLRDENAYQNSVTKIVLKKAVSRIRYRKKNNFNINSK